MQIGWIEVYAFESSITSNFGEGVEHGPYFRKIKLQSRMGYLYLIRRARDELSGIKECWERAIQAPWSNDYSVYIYIPRSE
jgi:hypothetical protein